MPDPDKLLTLRQAANQLNVHVRTLRRWIAAGTLRAQKLPGRWGGEYRIAEADVVALLGGPVQVAQQEFKTCAALRADGQPCRAPAVKGSEFCRHHRPKE